MNFEEESHSTEADESASHGISKADRKAVAANEENEALKTDMNLRCIGQYTMIFGLWF